MTEHPRRTPPGTEFAALHHREEPLLLPNAWDYASARALAGQGFRAVATTSLGVAAVAGLPDAVAATREETLRLALALGSQPLLLSVDAEGGFGDDPDEVAEFARELYAVGAAGINLEDGLGPAAHTAAKIAAVKRAVPALFVNARTDTHWLGDGDGADTLRRLDAYQEAGADCVFVPGLTDPYRIAALVRHLDVPLNVLYTPAGPPVRQLAGAGARRISLGSLLYRRALGAALEAAADIRAGRTPGGTTPSYGDVAGLLPPPG
ncbi:isocitrate lyase/PEP mutase family protein [Streptomyces sp. DT190]|jgi:2-methylisocitrate lyase-like PEP mutase family enzyme|uniref:isocitrate lyase/PEP mutase family protein n=1 Tax=unclassified Streptomyces TaxID=2593676 RepID=UPI003CE90519